MSATDEQRKPLPMTPETEARERLEAQSQQAVQANRWAAKHQSTVPSEYEKALAEIMENATVKVLLADLLALLSKPQGEAGVGEDAAVRTIMGVLRGMPELAAHLEALVQSERRLREALEAVRPYFEGEHSYDHPHCVLIRAALSEKPRTARPATFATCAGCPPTTGCRDERRCLHPDEGYGPPVPTQPPPHRMQG